MWDGWMKFKERSKTAGATQLTLLNLFKFATKNTGEIGLLYNYTGSERESMLSKMLQTDSLQLTVLFRIAAVSMEANL